MAQRGKPMRVAIAGFGTVGRSVARLLQELGVQGELGSELLTIRHGVTRFRITLICLQAIYRRGRFRPGVLGGP